MKSMFGETGRCFSPSIANKKDQSSILSLEHRNGRWQKAGTNPFYGLHHQGKAWIDTETWFLHNRFFFFSTSWTACMKSLCSVVEGQLSEVYSATAVMPFWEIYSHTLSQLYWQKSSKDTIGGPSSVRGDVGHFTLTSEKVSIASKKTDKSIFLISPVNFSTMSHLDLVLWVRWNQHWLLYLSFFYWTCAGSDTCLCPFLHSEMKKWKYTRARAFC